MLGELRAVLHAAEEAEDGMAMAHAHVDLADAGEHDAVPRAQSLILGLGFRSSEAGSTREQLFGWLADASCNWPAL
jgi:predicted ATPase